MIKTTKLISRASGARVIVSISRTKNKSVADEATGELDKLFDALCEAFVGASERLADRAAAGSLYKAYLDVGCVKEGDVLTVSRRIKVLLNGKIMAENESESRFRVVDGKCLKRLKNSKKQRFIPSRNGENIKNRRKRLPNLSENEK